MKLKLVWILGLNFPISKDLIFGLHYQIEIITTFDIGDLFCIFYSNWVEFDVFYNRLRFDHHHLYSSGNLIFE